MGESLIVGPSPVRSSAGVRHVFTFDEGRLEDADILGGKGAALCHLASLGLAVPPGFIASCVAGRTFIASGVLPASVVEEITAGIDALQDTVGRRLGDEVDPLLVSVRSGAPVSMPGMMDTVLNVGMNDVTVEAIARTTGDVDFAWACFERFVDSYARVVCAVPTQDLEVALLDVPLELSGEHRSRRIVALVSEICAQQGEPIPADPVEQILRAVDAVFASWSSSRATAYRRFKGIPDDLGSAATVQAMVFGNRDDRSASGVAFSRNPSSGAREAYGDVLFRAQGEDVVSGEFDAEPLSAIAARLPEVDRELRAALETVEADVKDLCEIEFTVEQGRLWILQTRVGQRSGLAAVRAAVDFASRGDVAITQAIRRVSPSQLESAVAPRFIYDGDREIVARGLPGAPGAAVGVAAFDPDRAASLKHEGHEVVLLRPTTSPNDVAGFIASVAVVTGRGGRTSHAAVVARGIGRVAVCGVGPILISEDGRSASIDGVPVEEGELLSVDGDAGTVVRGARTFRSETTDADVVRFLRWCEEHAQVPLVAPSAEGEVLELTDPEAIPPASVAALLGRLADDARVPVVHVTKPWALAADRVVTGTVRGVVRTDLASELLLAATLEPAGSV